MREFTIRKNDLRRRCRGKVRSRCEGQDTCPGKRRTMCTSTMRTILDFSIFALLVLVLTSCNVHAPVVYYEQDGVLMATDGDTTKVVFSEVEINYRVAQTGNAAYCFSVDNDAVYFCDGQNTNKIAEIHLGVIPGLSYTKTALASERGLFVTLPGEGDEVHLLSPDGKTLTPLGIEEMSSYPADVHSDQFYCIRGTVDDRGRLCNWPLWLRSVDLKTGLVTEVCLSDVLPDMHTGVYWADNGTVWTDGRSEQEAACIQQWDPYTGELLTEIPRWHDGNQIDYMAVYNGMLIYINHSRLCLRMPDGSTHLLMDLPEPVIDYLNYPPDIYFGEAAMVVLYETGTGEQMEYFTYPAE